MDDLSWEPDGVTLQVRFCEGGGTYRVTGIPAATHPIRHKAPFIHGLLRNFPHLAGEMDVVIHVEVLAGTG